MFRRCNPVEKRVLSYEAGIFLQMLGQHHRGLLPSDRKCFTFNLWFLMSMQFDQGKMDFWYD